MRAVILLCFFLSGASGLLFELLWTRMLTLVFGSTTLAVSTVLTAFMGGLGAGSLLAARFADRLRAPIRAYALAEAGIGLYALLVPWAIGHYGELNRWLWATFGDQYGLLSLLRFCAAALLLILPTTLMGATLPILARHFVARPGELRRVGGKLGTLYATNLFGACAGSFLAGFVFMPLYGVSTTNRIGAAFNLTLAAAALWAHARLSRQREEDRRPDLDELLAQAAAQGDVPAANVLPPVVELSARARVVVLAAFAVSGATAMTLQVLWTRALAVIIGSSIFSFTLILLAFLVGLGGGSASFGRIADRLRDPVRALGLVHLGIAAAVGVSYLILDDLPYAFTWLLASTSFGVDAILFCQFVLTCFAVLPATWLMGAIFPLTMRAVAGSLHHVGRDVGRTYAVNTAGAISGSFLAGFVVLPLLGLQKGIFFAVSAGLLVAAALFLVNPALSARQRRLGVGAAIALCGAGLLLPRWNLQSFSAGFFRVSIAHDYVERRKANKKWEMPSLEYYEDGIATTVSVDRWGKTFSLKNNGKVDASSDADMSTQIAVGLLPMLLHQGSTPPRAALIGFGSGVTTGGMTQAPFSSLEVIELEPAIYRASHFFDHVNHRPLANPKVTAHTGDGRNFLGQRSDRFDVIVSQPSNPWITGVSNLFTREYFQQIKTRLRPGGIFCQWAQLYELAPWNVKTLYRTLASEFPFVMVFAAEDLSSDTILIASDRPIPLDLARLERAFADPVLRAEANRAGWDGPHDVVAQVLLGPEELSSFTAGAPLNTDDNALIEFAAPRDLLGFARYDRYLMKVYGPQWPYGRLLGLVSGLHDAAGRLDHPARAGLLARSLLAHGRMREAEFWVRQAEARLREDQAGSDEVAHARLLLDLIVTRLDRDPEIPLAPAGDREPPQPPPGADARFRERLPADLREIDALIAAHRFVTAYKVLEDWPATVWEKPRPDFALLAGLLHYKAEYYQDAIGLLKPLAKDDAYVTRRPEALYYLGRAQYANAEPRAGVKALERFIQLQGKLGRPVRPASPGLGAGLLPAAPSVPGTPLPPRPVIDAAAP